MQLTMHDILYVNSITDLHPLRGTYCISYKMEAAAKSPLAGKDYVGLTIKTQKIWFRQMKSENQCPRVKLLKTLNCSKKKFAI